MNRIQNLYFLIGEDLVYFVFFSVFMYGGLWALWNVYLAKRIIHFVTLYRKSVEDAKTDLFDNCAELALHYKVEIVKYAFMLVINTTEIGGWLIYASGIGLANLSPTNTTINNYIIKIETTDLHVIGTPEVVLISVGQVGFLLSVALVTCLMKYLDAAYHNINNQSLKSTKIILLISCVIGALRIITGSIRQLFILEKLIYPIITLIYFSFWVKETRIFYKTLKWQSVEFKVRGRSSQIVKRAVKSSHHFAVIMCLVGITVLCLTLAEIVGDYFFMFTLFTYCPKLLNQLYGIPNYEPLFTTRPQLNALALSSEIKTGIQTNLSLIAFLTITIQYVVVTFVFFGGMLVKKLKYRFGRVRTRFTPNLTDPLLIS